MNTYRGGRGSLGACFRGRPRFPLIPQEGGAAWELSGPSLGGGDELLEQPTASSLTQSSGGEEEVRLIQLSRDLHIRGGGGGGGGGGDGGGGGRSEYMQSLGKGYLNKINKFR